METAIKKTNSIKITTKKMLCIVLVVLLGIPMGLLVACSSDFNATTFTYRRTIGGMPLNWSAHEWVSSTDSELLDYFQAPFYSRYEELDANGKPTFDRGIVNARSFPETAVSWPQDVTYAIATRSDGNHFGLDQGLDESNTENGGMKDNYERRAYSIPLRADLRWENGELITLDEFEWSMQMLLAPNRMPRRSDTFRLGDVALVGANAYNSQWRKDWQTEWQYGTGAQEIDINEYIPGYDSLQKEQQEAEIKNLEESSSDADKQNAVKIRAKLAWIAKWKLWNDGRDVKYRDSSTVEWDEVGFEIDDSTAGQTIVDPIYGNEVKTMGSVVFIYNNTAPAPINEHSMEDLIWSRWGGSGNDYLVYKDTFLANDTLLRPASDPASTHTVNLLLSNYGTSAASTVSSGPYKFLSMSPTNIILQKNPYWFGNNVKEFGSHFVATHININVISDASTRRMMFLNGLLDEFSLTGGDTDLAQSSRLRAITDTFSLRLFFNIDRDALNSINGKMNGSENLQYLANANFRQAFSLAMNRTAIAAAASPVATPSVVLWNQAYFNSMGYDYSDPNPENWIHRSQYRYSDTGLRAVVGKYSEDTDTINSLDSAKLREEYSHLTGFNASRAKELFAKAREEELALQNIPDNGQIVNVNMSIYLGNAAAVGTRATMLKAVQDSLNAVTPDNLKVTATPRAYWLEGKQYDGINNGLIEAIFGGWGGSSGAIASPLTSFLGLGLHDA
ncbi:MAG: ABC transporter substrate-binding protein, partial [Clostridiales bacterium]|nr:ABC transporter substrate-binding protein [Clostridiales bacterium]